MFNYIINYIMKKYIFNLVWSIILSLFVYIICNCLTFTLLYKSLIIIFLCILWSKYINNTNASLLILFILIISVINISYDLYNINKISGILQLPLIISLLYSFYCIYNE